MLDRIGPARDQMPVYLDVQNPLFASDRVCIWVEPIRIYDSGLGFTFHLLAKDPDEFSPDENSMAGGNLGHRPAFAIEISCDGTKADNSRDFRRPPSSDVVPTLMAQQGSATSEESEAVYYYSPLPKSGMIVVRMESKLHDLDAVVLMLDAQSILDCQTEARLRP